MIHDFVGLFILVQFDATLSTNVSDVLVLVSGLGNLSIEVGAALIACWVALRL